MYSVKLIVDKQKRLEVINDKILILNQVII